MRAIKFLGVLGVAVRRQRLRDGHPRHQARLQNCVLSRRARPRHLSTGQSCVTPCEGCTCRARDRFDVTFSMEGYETGTARVNSGWSLGGRRHSSPHLHPWRACRHGRRCVDRRHARSHAQSAGHDAGRREAEPPRCRRLRGYAAPTRLSRLTPFSAICLFSARAKALSGSLSRRFAHSPTAVWGCGAINA